jgi:hypothetical protein
VRERVLELEMSCRIRRDGIHCAPQRRLFEHELDEPEQILNVDP